MAGPRNRNSSFNVDDYHLNDFTITEIFGMVFLLLSIIFIHWAWVKKNLRFDSLCPKCKTIEFVKRKHRGKFSKKFIPFLRTNKLHCSRCNKTFYQAFSDK